MSDADYLDDGSGWVECYPGCIDETEELEKEIQETLRNLRRRKRGSSKKGVKTS